MSEKISNSSKRLIEMMDKLSLKQTDIVNRTGIAKSALSNYIHGTREPRQDQISKLADPYGINPAWLMGYDVPMFLNDTMNMLSEYNDNEEKLMNLYRNSTAEEQKMILQMVLYLLKNKQD